MPQTEEGYTRALPLRWEPAFPKKAVLPEGMEPRKEWEAALDSLRWLRTKLDAADRAAQRLLVLGDGGFCVADLFRELPRQTVLMARCARNRNLYELPGPQKERRRGPKRKYGDKARKPHQWLSEKAGWRRAEFMVRSRPVRPRYRVEGPFVLEKAAEQPVFLVAVKGHWKSGRRRVYLRPAFFLVSATWDGERWVMPFPAEELLATGWQRWEVEVLHREIKAGFGLGEVQCWSKEAAILAVQWQAWAYGVLVLAGYRAWGLSRSPIRPPGRWWSGSGRWSLNTLWSGYRAELWGSEKFCPVLSLSLIHI